MLAEGSSLARPRRGTVAQPWTEAMAVGWILPAIFSSKDMDWGWSRCKVIAIIDYFGAAAIGLYLPGAQTLFPRQGSPNVVVGHRGHHRNAVDPPQGQGAMSQ